jgi:hypothetical protein
MPWAAAAAWIAVVPIDDANLLRQGFILDFKLVYRNVYYFYKP